MNCSLVLKGKVLAPGGRDLGQIVTFFVLLGGAGDIYNSIRMLNYCDGPYLAHGIYARKERSAWTEV